MLNALCLLVSDMKNFIKNKNVSDIDLNKINVKFVYSYEIFLERKLIAIVQCGLVKYLYYNNNICSITFY